jgi:FkbM family methyltransferase
MVAYDLGANYGMHTLLFARLVGPSGKVYSFEPVPGIFKSLGEQVALNHFQNTVLVPKAVAEREGAMRFDLGHHEGAGHLASDGGVEVEITTLDHFVEEGNLPPGFIKIDIEGAESKALLGARKVIEKFRPNMMIELHNPGEDTAVGQFLMDLNYVAFRSEDGSQIRDMHKCWPDPTGIWGKIIALPTERQSIFRKL